LRQSRQNRQRLAWKMCLEACIQRHSVLRLMDLIENQDCIIIDWAKLNKIIEGSKTAVGSETLDMKHNWFTIHGEFRTNSNITTEEFMELLDLIEGAYGIRFIGSVKYAETKDEDYE